MSRRQLPIPQYRAVGGSHKRFFKFIRAAPCKTHDVPSRIVKPRWHAIRNGGEQLAAIEHGGDSRRGIGRVKGGGPVDAMRSAAAGFRPVARARREIPQEPSPAVPADDKFRLACRQHAVRIRIHAKRDLDVVGGRPRERQREAERMPPVRAHHERHVGRRLRVGILSGRQGDGRSRM